jgi:ABC-type nitrate/sulfonate/bicarbonate transport system ATPase subunit
MNAPIPYALKERLLTVDIKSLSFGPKSILHNINFYVDNITRVGVNQGQVVGLLGPSGIGKTQLFKCLAGLQQQATVVGTVVINELGHGPHPGDVGVVFQSYPLLEWRTVWSNFELAVRSDKAKLARAKELANAFGIEERLQAYPSQLSGGQRQRAAIIQQLLCSCHFLLLDEPFSGLDPKAKRQACELLRAVSLQDELNTQIIVTHDIDSAIELCDTLLILGRTPNVAGATIVKRIDLIARGLAWQPDVRKLPEFKQTSEEINDLFMTL